MVLSIPKIAIFYIVGSDSAIVRCWRLCDGAFTSTSLSYSEYERDSVTGLLITSYNDVIVSSMNVSGGGRNDSAMDFRRYRISSKSSHSTKLAFDEIGVLNGIQKVDQQKLPIIELTRTSVLVGIDGRLLLFDWTNPLQDSYFEYSINCLNETVTREVPDFGSSPFSFSILASQKMKIVTEDNVYPVFRLIRDGNVIYIQSKDTNAFYFRDRERQYLHRLNAHIVDNFRSNILQRTQIHGWIFYTKFRL
jgi:hypothetical protein